MTYRTGSHWHVTIVREPDGAAECPVPDCPVHEAELVAVVVNGDQALAERICALLNAERPTHTPDVDYARGAAEALAHVRRLLDASMPPALIATFAVRRLLDETAAELGVDEDALTARASVPVAAETVHVEGTGEDFGRSQLGPNSWW